MLYIRLLDDAEMACHLLPSPHVYNYLGPDRMWIHRNVHVVPSQQQTCDILTWNTVKFRGGSFVDVERIDYTLSKARIEALAKSGLSRVAANWNTVHGSRSAGVGRCCVLRLIAMIKALSTFSA